MLPNCHLFPNRTNIAKLFDTSARLVIMVKRSQLRNNSRYQPATNTNPTGLQGHSGATLRLDGLFPPRRGLRRPEMLDRVVDALLGVSREIVV